MALNQDDQDWLSGRFLRHREAIADQLVEEFGKQATGDWRDPGKEGQGRGKPVGLRRIVVWLEKVAAERKRFHPRFAGGEEPLLERIDRTIHKWLSQCVHHTAVGLPFAPVDEDEVEVPLIRS